MTMIFVDRRSIEPKILFSCSGTIIKTVKFLKTQSTIKKTSGIFRSDLPNFVSHNVNLKVVGVV